MTAEATTRDAAFVCEARKSGRSPAMPVSITATPTPLPVASFHRFGVLADWLYAVTILFGSNDERLGLVAAFSETARTPGGSARRCASRASRRAEKALISPIGLAGVAAGGLHERACGRPRTAPGSQPDDHLDAACRGRSVRARRASASRAEPPATAPSCAGAGPASGRQGNDGEECQQADACRDESPAVLGRDLGQRTGGAAPPSRPQKDLLVLAQKVARRPGAPELVG